MCNNRVLTEQAGVLGERMGKGPLAQPDGHQETSAELRTETMLLAVGLMGFTVF